MLFRRADCVPHADCGAPLLSLFLLRCTRAKKFFWGLLNFFLTLRAFSYIIYLYESGLVRPFVF